MSRPPRLPFCATRVVKGSLLLSDSLKLIWLEHYALDRVRGDGAYIGAGPMGQRLGKSRDAINSARRELLRLQLLVAAARARGMTGTYFPALPAASIPTSERPVVETVTAATEQLDLHIRKVRSVAPAPESGAPSAMARGDTLSPPTRQSISEGSRLKCRPGQGAEFATVGEVLQPQVGELQILQPQVGGSFAHANGRPEERRAPRGAVPAPEDHCDRCGEPLAVTPRGRFVPCPCSGPAFALP